MPVTIVHCSDVHLETTFPETRGGASRRHALAEAFARIVDVALEHDADALTIGGDLYESERAGPQTVRFLFEHFSRFGRPVYIAPGNHDPYSPSSLLAREDVPENVRIFNETAWRAYPLASDVTLWGFGHSPAEPGRPFAGARFDRPGVQLALVHGSDEERCPPGKRATAPFTAQEVAASGATLALTGHYHGGYVTHHNGAPIVAYPGSPEPIKFGEGETHGALLVVVDNGHVSLTALPIALTRALEVQCDLGGLDNESAVLGALTKTLTSFGARDYVRVQLHGQVAPGTRIDTALMVERLESKLGSLEIVDDTVAFDYAAIAREPTVRGHAVRDLLALLDDLEAREGAAGPGAAAGGGTPLSLDFDATPSANDVRHALRYAIAAFEGTEIAP